MSQNGLPPKRRDDRKPQLEHQQQWTKPTIGYNTDPCIQIDVAPRISMKLGQLLGIGAAKPYVIDMTPQHVLELDEGSMSLTVPRPQQSVPFILEFTNLTYSVMTGRHMDIAPCLSPVVAAFKKTSNSKVLLNAISGEAKDGEIMAVLGASGSGKSTLIDALANRIARDSLKGTITLNGEPLESRLLKSISAYVMQDDILYPMLTVEETLMFSAKFRLPKTLSYAKKRARVEALIDQLGLNAAAKTVVGDEGHRGISGGERRRVSIGIDIIHDPVMLFLDEPTSGLDSTSAFMVVKVLQRIAQSGSVVVMSVHQPSYRILGLVDRVLFLSKGYTVYNGSPSDLPGFFERFGCPIPENENRTEFALDLIRELEGSPKGTKSLVEFNKSWQMNTNTVRNCSKLNRLSLKNSIAASISNGKLVSGTTSGSVATFANPWWKEMLVIAERNITNSKRMPELFIIRFGAVIVTGFIIATLFWKLDNTPKGIQERLSVLAFAMSTTFYTCAEALPVFLQERFIFMRETAYNSYRRSSYVIAHGIMSIPMLVLLSILLAMIVFWSTGLAGGIPGFLYFIAALVASFWAGHSFVTFLSGVVSHVILGYVVVISSLAYFLLFSGFFISRPRIPPYWLWFHYISMVKYPYEGVLINEFDDPNKCFVRGIQTFDNTPLEHLSAQVKELVLDQMSKSLNLGINTTSCLTNGTQILAQQGVTQLSKWNCLWITLAWGFLFQILFYFALLIGSKNKRS